MRSLPTVRVVADGFPGHLPVWFPPPIADEAEKMPVSAALLQQLREWNERGQDLTERTDPRTVTAHYSVGAYLASQLAKELEGSYVVEMRMAGSVSQGWRSIAPAPS